MHEDKIIVVGRLGCRGLVDVTNGPLRGTRSRAVQSERHALALQFIAGT